MKISAEKLYLLTDTVIPRATEVLFNAFQHDPVFNAIFEGATREQRSALYDTTLRYCLRYGQVWAPSPNLEGVAGWVWGRQSSMTPWRMLVSGAIWPALKMGGKYSQRMATAFKPVDEDRKRHMSGQPYLYLFMIGVSAGYQGQGYGRILLDEVIGFAERDGMAVCLETETDDNVRLYEHFGFEVIKKVTLPLVNLPMWEMVRLPKLA